MTKQEIEETLRQYLRREPFQPFVLEMVDGTTIDIDHPGVAIGGSGATYICPNYDLLDFTWENVRGFRVAAQEAAS